MDPAELQNLNGFNLPDLPTKPRRFGEEENYATKQEGRTTEAQAICPKED